jgi:UDP-N-acetyl-D-mannosaminuronic acid dehydrogenase
MITEKLMKLYPNQVFAVEPNVHEVVDHHGKKDIALIDYSNSVEVADVAVLLVNHKEFMTQKLVFKPNVILVDTKGIW